MQEEITNRTIALSIRGAEMSFHTMQRAVQAALREMEKGTRKQKTRSQDNVLLKKKQTLKSLMQSGDSLSSEEISKDMLKPLRRIARKYHVQYSVVKEKGSDPPHYLAFFRTKDTEAAQAAFNEFSRTKFKITEPGSIRENLERITAIQNEKKAVRKAPEKTVKKVLEKTRIPENPFK